MNMYVAIMCFLSELSNSGWDCLTFVSCLLLKILVEWHFSSSNMTTCPNKLHLFLLCLNEVLIQFNIVSNEHSLIRKVAELVDAYTWHQPAAYTCYLTLCVFTWYQHFPHFPHLLSNTLWYPHFPHSQPTLLLIAAARGANDNERLPPEASGPWSSSHHPLSLSLSFVVRAVCLQCIARAHIRLCNDDHLSVFTAGEIVCLT